MTAMTADTGQRQSSRARAVEPPADAPTREACSFGAALHQTHQNYAAPISPSASRRPVTATSRYPSSSSWPPSRPIPAAARPILWD
jgi:hypothetical protein